MWCSDIIAILEIIKAANGDFCIQRIENNIIYFTNHKKIYFRDIIEIQNMIEFKKRFKKRLKDLDTIE